MRRIWVWSLLCVGLLSASSVFAQLPRIVACPSFSMGMWGGNPDIWYAPYCNPDSGAVALTLPPGSSASACPSGTNCVGGLTEEDGTLPMPFPQSLSKGYPDKLFPVKPFKLLHGIRSNSMKDYVVRFQDDKGGTRYARVVHAEIPAQVVELPPQAFGPNSPPNGQATIVNMKAFTMKNAVEVSDQGVAPGSIVVATAADKPDAGWNVYRITFPTQAGASLSVDVLMHE